MHGSVSFCKSMCYEKLGANMIMRLTICGCYEQIKLGQKYYGISRNCL